MQRNDFLHELHILHQPHNVVGEELDGRNRSDAARIQRRRMHVAAFHQAEHLARHAAHLQGFAIERAGKRIQRRHDVGDGAVAVQVGVRAPRLFRFRPHPGIGFLHHLLAEVHADQVVLKDIVVEHVLGGFAEVDDPLGHGRRTNAERHVLRISRAGRVVVAADAADAAGDEVGVARILPLHENAVAAEDRRSAVALRHLAVGKIDLGEDAQAAHDSRNRVPVHLDEVPALGSGLFGRRSNRAHVESLLSVVSRRS